MTPQLTTQLDLHRLTVFWTVVNEGTMARAGERLHISQPAISAHIKALERGMGVSLFDRVGRRSVVNPAGRLLYEKAEDVLSAADNLATSMADLRGMSSGRLNLGASFVWQHHLPKVLDGFKREHPLVEMTVQFASSARIETLVAERALEIGFIGWRSERPELASLSVTEDAVIGVCAPTHPLASTAKTSPRDLEEHAFIVREPGSATRRATDRMMESQGIRPRVYMELGAQEAIVEAAKSGGGVGMVASLGVKPQLNSGALVLVQRGSFESVLPLHAVFHRQKTLTRVQRAFLDTVPAGGSTPYSA